MHAYSSILLALAALLALLLIGVAIWVLTPAQPQPQALAGLQPGPELAVDVDPWIAFQPNRPRSTGFVLYPGARVEPQVYAATVRAIAEEGYLSVIVPMPLNLAILAPARGQAAMQAFPQIEHWVIGGHSLGGAMAARFALSHPERVAGLVLWASRPARGDDLSQLTIPVTSIYGSDDTLVRPETIAASRAVLPAGTTFVEIAGGNHSQFGRYPAQLGSGAASISADDQRAQVVKATLTLLSAVDGGDR